jgi:hypothetical protein
VASIGGPSGSGAALAGGFVEDDGTGCGNVERADTARHWNPEQVIAGAADEIVKAGAFAAKHEDTVAGEVELVVVGSATFVEADDPYVLLLQVLEGANEVDDAGDAQVFGGSGAGLYGHWTERRGAAFGKDDAVDASSVCNAEESTKILRIFNTVEGQEQTRLRWIGRGEKILDGKGFLLADEGDNALMCRSASKVRELIARFLADAHARLLAFSDEACEAFVVALGGDNNVIEAASASLESLGNGVHAVESFHVLSVDGACYGCDRRRATATQLSMALAARRSRPSMVCE